MFFPFSQTTNAKQFLAHGLTSNFIKYGMGQKLMDLKKNNQKLFKGQEING